MSKAVKTKTTLPLFSMTGFASSQFLSTWNFEIRSVNHRFLEIKLRLAKELVGLENEIRTFFESQLSQKGVKRGSIEVSLAKNPKTTKGSNGLHTEELTLDKAACIKRWNEFLSLQKSLKIKTPPQFSDLIHTPGVFISETSNINLETVKPSLLKALENLITLWLQMKTREGATLKKALFDQLQKIENHLQTIEEEKKRWISNQQKKLKDRITTVFSDFSLAVGSGNFSQSTSSTPSEYKTSQADLSEVIKNVLQSRISQELQISLERADIQEEVDRFYSHLSQLKDHLLTGGTVGRKLDFIVQELNREINTLGNKAQDATISQHAVEIKVLLEQIREQTMNLE